MKSIRFQLIVAMVTLVVLVSTLLGVIAYNESRKAIDGYAVRMVASAADNRKQLLLEYLKRQQERAATFLENAELACGPSGRMNTLCLRETLVEFMKAESAVAARIDLGNSYFLNAGDIRLFASLSHTPDVAIAVFASEKPVNFYAIHAENPDLHFRLEMAYRVQDLAEIFGNNGLGPSGEVILLTPQGASLNFNDVTARKSKIPTTPSQIQDIPSKKCLQGSSGEILAPDWHGEKSIHAYRTMPEIGGGCVIARVNQASALVAPAQLKKTFISLGLVFVGAGIAVAFILAYVIAAPIARLKLRVRGWQGGDFTSPVPLDGPSEVRECAAAFDSMAQSLVQSRAALVEKEKSAATASLAASLAHELNNPLAALTYSLALMRMQNELHGKGHDYLDMATQETSRMARITKGILALYSDNALPMRVDLNRLLDQVVQSRHELLEDNAIQLDRRYDFRGEINCFPRELAQAVSHILDNAIIALQQPVASENAAAKLEEPPAPGKNKRITLHVSYSRQFSAPFQPGVRIVIADNGPGIKPESRRSIFGAFVTTSGEKGSGLGLWITQAIAHKHGGFIRLHSCIQQARSGSAFCIFLPVL